MQTQRNDSPLPASQPFLEQLRGRVGALKINRLTQPAQEYDQKIQAQMIVGSWHNTLAWLIQNFDHAQDNLTQEPGDAFRHLARAFGEKPRRQLQLAKKALTTVHLELEKNTPSQQMIRQALHYATGELRELHDQISTAVENACDEASREKGRKAAQPEMPHEAPMKAVDVLQGLLLSVESQGPEILAVLERERTK